MQKVEGKVGRLVAANGMLFAVTLDGKLIAFGKDRVPVQTHLEKADPPPDRREAPNRRAPSSTRRG